jgi:hypothetical protein
MEKKNMMSFIDWLNYDSGGGPTWMFFVLILFGILDVIFWTIIVKIHSRHKKSKIIKSDISKVDTKKTPK